MSELILDPILKEIETETQEKDIFSLRELLEMDITDAPCLWNPFFRDIGVHALVGEPDSGKSLFCLQLALTIAYGKDQFLGYPLNLKYRKSIFIETEDDQKEVARRVKKQVNGLGFGFPIDDNFIFWTADITDIGSKKNIFNRLRVMLDKNPVDLIVVSSFGDVFLGSDSNANIQMRDTVNHFFAIAKEYENLILLIHHINKSQYNKNPTQAGIQGGSGFTQKIRLAAHLSNGNDNRYFSISKGNHIPRDIKRNAVSLKLDEQYLFFKNTGEMIPKNEIESTINPKVNRTEIDWQEIFGNENHQRRGQLIALCINKYNVSESAIDKRLKQSVNSGNLIKDEYGFYSLPE